MAAKAAAPLATASCEAAGAPGLCEGRGEREVQMRIEGAGCACRAWLMLVEEKFVDNLLSQDNKKKRWREKNKRKHNKDKEKGRGDACLCGSARGGWRKGWKAAWAGGPRSVRQRERARGHTNTKRDAARKHTRAQGPARRSARGAPREGGGSRQRAGFR